ncbi:MAG: dihydrolipoamide acetyltransferase [Deltaproteobacteria bacterium]|nr:dihydrolipoamide acetyltransferase [Deltaproteobacteria bacterium]
MNNSCSVLTSPILFAAAVLAVPSFAAAGTAEGQTETVVETGAAPAEPTTPEAKPAAGVTTPEEKPAAGATTPAAQAAPPNEAALNIKLRDIEERVNELKEKIFQSKARLIQLQEVVLHGAISGAKAVLTHRNEMGSSFILRRAQYALDGAPIVNRTDETGNELNDQEEIEVFNGSIAPGNHQISVYLEYQGYGFGVFSYLKGYRFKIKSSYTFNAEEGKLTSVKIVGYEKGGMTAELKDRPAVRYDIESAHAARPATGDNTDAATAGPANR